MTYLDVLQIYGIYRADYIPQLFSLRLPSPEVIFELLKKANAKALIYDSSFEPLIKNSPVPAHLASNAKDVGTIPEHLPEMSVPSLGDTAFMFHTSGSTSGSPKLVPWTFAWLGSHLEKFKALGFSQGRDQVGSWIGSMCHGGQSGGTRAT
jgi:acyl-CoA synthetase (AMP-forming)/AMP-acid ligase II